MLLAMGQMLGRFWLANAILLDEPDDLKTALLAHVKLTLCLWEPYATESGRRELAGLLA